MADAARLEGEVAAAGRREKELQLFVEVLQEGCALERPPAQQQAAERRLQEEVEALKAQLGGHELAAKVQRPLQNRPLNPKPYTQLGGQELAAKVQSRPRNWSFFPSGYLSRWVGPSSFSLVTKNRPCH